MAKGTDDALERRVLGAEGEWHARRTVSQDLTELATDALVAGWDSQSLRVLAGERPTINPFDLGELFERAMQELGRPVPSAARAQWMFIHYLCWLVVTGCISPLDGGQRLEKLMYAGSGASGELGYISGLVDEWQGGWGGSHAEVEADLRRAAGELLARPLPE